MEYDDLLNPGLNDTRRFGQETSTLTAVFPYDEGSGFESRSTEPYVGQDTEKLLAYSVFKPTIARFDVKHDDFSELPIVFEGLELSQSHDDAPLLNDSESIWAKTADVLLNNSAGIINLEQELIFEGDSSDYVINTNQANNNEVSTPVTLLPQVIKELGGPNLKEVKQQSTTIYQFNNCQFAGGFADTVHGSQVGGAINSNNRDASQSCLFELTEENIEDIISEVSNDYAADTNVALRRIKIAEQVILDLEQNIDLKRKVIKSLRALEADGDRKKSTNRIVNIVLEALDETD